jgi:signal transduction histidine kinase
LRNKVTIFKRIFNFNKNHFKAFSLIILLLCQLPLKSQEMEKYDSLISKIYSSGIPDDTIKVKLLYELAVAGSKAGVQENFEKGGHTKNVNFYCYEAVRLSIVLNYRNGINLFFKTFSTIYNQKTDLPVPGFMDFDDEISNMNFKDLNYSRNKKHFGSLDNYVRAIQQLHEMKADINVHLLEYWIGLVYFDWFNYRRAIENFRLAVYSDGIKNDSITLGDICQFIGASYFYSGCYDSSEVYYRKSISVADKKNEPFRYGIYLLNLGKLYFQQSNYSASLELYKKSLQFFSPEVDSAYIAYAMSEMGAIYSAINEFGSAKEVFLKSLDISIKLKDKALQGMIYKNLSLLFAATGEYKKAYMYQKKMHQVKDSLFIYEVAAYNDSYEENWQNAIGREITKKESESLKREETTIALNKSRLSQLALGLVIFFVLIIASYTYRLYQLKQKANIYLSELNKSKEKLLSVISHDVRGPITGFIDLLEPMNQQINTISSKQVAGYLRQITDLSQNIKLLLDNLLEWTKTQQGLIVYTPEVFRLNDIINRNIDIYRQIADSKGITLKCNVNPGIKILADRNMIQVVFRNLLNNSVKFTGAGGSITIDTRREDDKVIVSVTDTGIGISKEMKDALFIKDNKSKDYSAGLKSSGIGLVLCREYLEKCGGEIWVESDGKDTGSTFFFSVKTAEKNE